MENNINMVKFATHDLISKENLIKAINEAFPDDILIASVSTVEMTDGTKAQSVCFGKILDI